MIGDLLAPLGVGAQLLRQFGNASFGLQHRTHAGNIVDAGGDGGDRMIPSSPSSNVAPTMMLAS